MAKHLDLLEWYYYDSDTGVILRAKKPNRGPGNVGDEAKADITDKGYALCSINGKSYKRARLAWMYMTGEWPKQQIDHINGIRDDDRWCNLRLATNSQNKMNSRGCSKLGLPKWVSKNKNKYYGIVRYNNKTYRCKGGFETPQEAHNKAKELAQTLHKQFFNGG